METVVDLSVIIASYNTKDLLRDCLESIYLNTREISHETIVVDDCSTDGSQDMVRDIFPQVRLICNPTNLRYSKTNNAGLQAARGRYGLLLNSDVKISSGAFDELVRFMDAHSDVAAAGPKLINPDGSVQHCIRSFPSLLPMIAQSINLHKIWPGNPFTDKYYNTHFNYDKAQPVESIGTTAFIIRRSTWESYGMLDERFTHHLVDLAYCYSLKERQQSIYYVPTATVVHYGGQSVNQDSLNEIKSIHEALRQFYDLYYAPKHNMFERLLIRSGIWARRQFKVLEYHFSSDKRAIKGPGAAPIVSGHSQAK